MLELRDLETQQIGLRMPKYLVNDVDEIIADYNINRSTFINNAIQQVVQEQKEQRFYERFESSIAELKLVLDGKSSSKSLEDLIDELED
jgi:metal-responsive CopG/Arc/MetJ family transcriptional regulator